jgi:hypothetical protein
MPSTSRSTRCTLSSTNSTDGVSAGAGGVEDEDVAQGVEHVEKVVGDLDGADAVPLGLGGDVLDG